MTASAIVDSAAPRVAESTLPALDSMRAVAAIAVLATHASFWGGAYGRSEFGTALARLDIGVAIFFVLSGFLLSRAWLDRHARGMRGPRAPHYFWKRALRIIPVYVLAVVAALLLLPDNEDAGPGVWLKTLTMTNLYVDDHLPHGLTQMWSLATEVAFYLVLPALMWVVLSRRRDAQPSSGVIWPAMICLGLLNALWLLALAPALESAAPLSALWLPSYLSWFGVGLVLAECHVQVHRAQPGEVSRIAVMLQQMGRSPGVCWTAGLALFAISATPIAGPSSLTAPTLGEALIKNLLYAAISGLLVLPCVFAHPKGGFQRVMSNRFLRHLGHISYGVFCFHLVILELVARGREMDLFEGRTFELFAITLLITLVVSDLVYRLVERPLLRFKDLPRGRGRSTQSDSARPAATSS